MIIDREKHEFQQSIEFKRFFKKKIVKWETIWVICRNKFRVIELWLRIEKQINYIYSIKKIDIDQLVRVIDVLNDLLFYQSRQYNLKQKWEKKSKTWFRVFFIWEREWKHVVVVKKKQNTMIIKLFSKLWINLSIFTNISSTILKQQFHEISNSKFISIVLKTKTQTIAILYAISSRNVLITFSKSTTYIRNRAR